MQSDIGKANILTAIKNHLKPDGKFLSHEMVVRHNEKQARQSLSQAIRVNANSLTEEEWKQTCKEAGLTVQQQQTGAMKLLDL